ncbi:MAG: hypothetical protein EP314_05475 [Bacteroidetes bacterium]|nr:MAG: hypothetical protein EP314_05475 [Bacteroidota bacterium]
MRKAIFSLCIVLLATHWGCKQDIGNAQWDVDVLAPVIKTRLTLADLVADSLFVADAEGALRLKIETPLIDLPLDSILQIPDTSVEKAISLPIALNNVQPGTEIFPLSDETQYDLDQLALKRVVLRSGKLRLKVKSVLATAVDFTYQIPVARLFGTPFETFQSVPAGSISDTAFATFEFDLSGYDIDLRGSNGSGFNTLVTTYILSTSEDGQVVSIPANSPFFFLEYSFIGILPDYGTGYFGQQNTSAQEEITELEALSRITEGQLLLDSVTIGLSVTNGVGADATFLLSGLSSINTRQNSVIELDHELIGNTILLTRALDPAGNANDVIASERHYVLNNGNSNIKQFIENLPDQLGFTFDFQLNPLGNVSSGNDFFYYDRPFQALMDIDIPLRTTLTNLTLVDTLDWNLSESAVIDAVNSGSFTLVALNGFPMEALIELVLLDENDAILDTLIVPSTVAAPAVDAQNRVIAPLESRIEIPVPDRTSGVLPQTRRIRIATRFNTVSQPELIQLYDSNGIDIKLIGNFNINIGPSL